MRISVFVEAFIVGVMVIILGLFLNFLVLNPILHLFLLGFLIHIFCEISGINTWYCKNGSACLVHPASFDKVHPASV